MKTYERLFKLKMFQKHKLIFYTISILLLLSKTSAAIDTLNHIDENNMKQGYWVYTNKTKRLPNYKESQVVEEGNYTDDKKTGKWIFYYNNNKVKQILTYADNRPNGHAVFYYKNGNKKEEGTWKNNKWVGNYTYYYENGEVRNDWKYNQSGQRTGVQKYYYENGQLMIEGEWLNGKEAGTIVEYYEDGSVKSERTFQNGTLDTGMTKKYSPQEKEGKVTVKKTSENTSEGLDKEKKIIVKKSVSKKDIAPWNGTGERQFYNKKGKVVREGYFEDGYLINGKMYQYLPNGSKSKTIIYEEGKAVKEISHTTEEQIKK
tara:strand:- start:11313 stop:12263 length:951 start_codon:yes stop_codon:yes gene_type:complete